MSQEDYSSRVQTFLDNLAFINGWNAENEAGDVDRHTLELNKFADWSQVSPGAGKLGSGLSSASRKHRQPSGLKEVACTFLWRKLLLSCTLFYARHEGPGCHDGAGNSPP